jgi:ATP-dependent Zn protease
MNRVTLATASVATSLCLLIGALAPGAIAAGSSATEPNESEAAFAQQLAAKRVQSVSINKLLRTMRVTLKDGTQVITRYPKKQSEQTAARLRARGVAVTVLSPTEAKKEAKLHKTHKKHKGTKHKLRYIVGAVVIVVIVLAIGVLLFSRRRRQLD